MTQPSMPEPTTPPPRRRWRKVLFIFSLLAVAGVAGGAWWVWVFVQEKLAPLVAAGLSQELQRPVQMGRLERAGLTSLRFGPTELPATATDADWAKVQAVEVQFDPWQVLWQRKLPLVVDLIKPELFLEQDQKGLWVNLKSKPPVAKGAIEIQLTQLRFNEAKAELLPRAKPKQQRQSVRLEKIQGFIKLRENNRRFSYELRGQSAAEGGFRVLGESKRVTNKDLLSKLNLEGNNFLVGEIDRLIRLPVDITAGRVDGKVDVTLNPDLTYHLLGRAQLKKVSLTSPGSPKPINEATGPIELENQTVKLKNVKAKFDKIPFVASGSIDPKQGFDLKANLPNVEIPGFFQTFQLKTPVPVTGMVNATVTMTGPVQTPIINGIVENQGLVTVDRLAIERANGKFRLDTAAKMLEVTNLNIAPKVGGMVTGGGKINITPPQTLDFALQVRDVPGDPIAKLYGAQSLPLQIGGVNAQIAVKGRADDPITTAIWQAPKATYAATGEVVITKSGNLVDLRRMEATAYGGKVNITGQFIDRRNFQGNVQLGTIQLAQFNPQLTGNATGNAQVRGQISDAGLADLSGQARLEANTLGGTIVTQAQFQDQSWRADVNLGNVQLAQANPQLRGAADGMVRLRGNVNNPTLAAITADGMVRLSQGIALVTDPIAAQFNWDGQHINLKSATAPGFQADGVIFAKVDGTPEVTGLDLNVNASRLALAALALPLPTAVSVVGDASFNGKIIGTPTKPQVKGNLGLLDFGVNGIAFEPLQGTVDINPNGLQLNLLGPQDRLRLSLNAQNQPLAVEVQRGKLSIAGKAQGNLFNVALREMPLNELGALGLPIANVRGVLSGTASLNLATMEMPDAFLSIDQPQFGQFPAAFQGNRIQTRLSYVNGVAKGNVAIHQPRLGNFVSTDISTNFVYANHVFRISDFVLQKNESQIAIAGALDWRQRTPRLEGNVRVTKGRIEDLLGAAQIFELTDFARGLSLPSYSNSVDLANLSVGAPSSSNLSLKTQLERLAEVNTKIRQIRDERKSLLRQIPGEDRNENILPQLADVRGLFDSNLRFSTGPKGINIDEFEFNAKHVEWRPFPGYAEFQRLGPQVRVLQRDNQILQAQSVLISATYKEGQLDLTRATAQLGEATVNLQLNYGGENTSGQLTVNKLPILEIQKFYPIPIPLAGELNATASLGGTKTQPSAGGFITIKEGGINGHPIASANSFFNYKEGRLNVDTTIKLDNPEPLKIVGEIPIPLPFINVYPSNDDIDLKINVKNEGLALMNLFNAPLAWKDGQGQVNLTIGGKLLAPSASGEIVLQNASFTTPSLPEPLTNVNGIIRFDQDRVRVESLKGEFSQGNVAAKGSLPLFKSLVSLPIPIDVASQGCLSEDANNPLNMEMNRIKLSYKGLYQGAVRGCVNVAGNIFKPKLSGEITLSQGQVLLSDEMAQNSPAAASGTEGVVTNSTGLEFDNLRLTLGNGIQIVRAPILNFVAQGTLTLNGDLNRPQPVGKIFLRSGQVNLFTTQFVLARGYTHTAIFTQNLNPLIDVRMIASVPEVTRSPINTQQTVTSEVNDSPLFATNLGSLQTVRIQAAVQGRSDEIFSRLELTSSPSRSRNEIIGLLGGGFVNTLGRGDSTLGIANLAGSALLTNIQGFIGNALGLSEFRLFPTIATDAEKRTSTLGLAAEAGFDITPSLSASVLKILTSDQPAQFGLRYRINDNFLFRGSTDFSGDSRAVLEYDVRF